MADGSRSSPETAAWSRLLMPSVADLMFVAVLFLLAFTPLSVKLLADAGVGWHIRTGEQILVTHSVPRVDSFSSSMRGAPWFAWEWLHDLLVGQIETSLGLNGVVWFTATVIAAVFAWMFRLLLQRGANLFIAVPVVLLALSASTIHFLARPHVVSWLLTLAWFCILDSSERNSTTRSPGYKSLWMLPPLMLLWVNMHGGFLIGFVLLAIFWLGALWEYFRCTQTRLEDVLLRLRSGQRVRQLTIVAALSAFATFINPYGWKLHAHVYSYLSSRFLMDHIDEFQSPNFHGVAQRCFLVLLLIVLGIVIIRGRELRMSHCLTVLFAFYAGLYASRNIPVAAILLVMIGAPLVPAGVAQSFSRRMSAVELSLRGHLWPNLAIVLTLAIAANHGRAGATQLMDAHFDPARMPVRALDYLQAHNLQTPILAPDYWGGYLIYRLPPGSVVVDDRHDFYGEAFFRSYLKMVHVESGWQDFLRDHPAGCLVMPRNAALAGVLTESQAWKTVYSDNVAVAFVPVSPKPVNP